MPKDKSFQDFRHIVTSKEETSLENHISSPFSLDAEAHKNTKSACPSSEEIFIQDENQKGDDPHQSFYDYAVIAPPLKEDILSPKGHRERLKKRFMKSGAQNFSDAEFLELLLFRSIPRRDTKPLAKTLIAHFGSFAEVISASEHRLKEVKGVGDGVVMDFKLLHAALERMARESLRERPLLNSWTKLLDYCRTSMGYSNIEEFRILFLDRRNHLIADEVQQRGTIDHTPVYPREVIKRSLELSAAALILIHNHPSGDPTPSGADIAMTKAIMDIATPMGIQIHDHIIITKDSHASFKGLKLI